MPIHTSTHAEQRRGRALEEERPAQHDPKATQRLRLNESPDFDASPDPNATLQVRLADQAGPAEQAPSADALSTQPIRRDPDAAPAPRTAPRGASWRQWAARHKRTLILSAVLVGIAVLAISGLALKNAQDVQRAVIGLGGPQMRAALLAQADLSGQNLQWADLRQADLRQANLAGADLLGANLSGANLDGANLEGANLRGTDLSGARLGQTALRGADLHWAVLRNAQLGKADLSQTDLQGADLENASLLGANLEGANLKNAHMLGTMMPDGSAWTPRTDVRRFTDPSHPDFWRPGDAQSLAHR